MARSASPAAALAISAVGKHAVAICMFPTASRTVRCVFDLVSCFAVLCALMTARELQIGGGSGCTQEAPRGHGARRGKSD